jgi:hypothetical protein
MSIRKQHLAARIFVLAFLKILDAALLRQRFPKRCGLDRNAQPECLKEHDTH